MLMGALERIPPLPESSIQYRGQEIYRKGGGALLTKDYGRGLSEGRQLVWAEGRPGLPQRQHA